MSTPRQISKAFAAALRANRVEFNARFAQARRLHPVLEGDAFQGFLVEQADPVVSAVASVSADALPDVAAAVYDIGLELVGQGLAGPRARQSVINEGWAQLLPASAELIAAAPTRVLGSLCNALHYLGRTPDARPVQWITEMRGFAHESRADVDLFLKLGQIAAWRAGLAHFRADALALADTLPPPLALRAVGASDHADWRAVRAALGEDPWFIPGQPAKGVRVATRAGAFRGFGGLFTRPPVVASDGQQFFVRSGEGCWLLTADAFGATFHRAGAEEFTAAADSPPSLQVRCDGSFLTVRNRQIALPLPGAATSLATTAATLALTTAHSHAILFVALHDTPAVR